MPMREARLEALLARLAGLRILVAGDYFLDRYLIMDPSLTEHSLETGRDARQVVAIRNSPGAAGTVTNNLRALGAQVLALGIIGQDGLGYELLHALQANGVDTSALIQSPERFTPTYTKPMMVQPGGSERELERIDIKNRTATPAALEARAIEALVQLSPSVDGIVVSDQVPEEGCGVITARVRTALIDLAARYPAKPIVADSRARIGLFRHIIVKPNEYEAYRAVYGHAPEAPPTPEQTTACGTALEQRTGRPVFLTVGARGILVIHEGRVTHVPGIAVKPPIDSVGAGDSAMAAIVTALCAGATEVEAAEIANLAASITIQQLGTTGTANPGQIRARFREVRA